MQRSRTLVVATAWAVVFSAAAPWALRAQPPGGPGGMPPPPGGGEAGNPLMIALAPAVQVELKMTEAQKTKLYNLAKTSGQKSRETFQALMFSGGPVNPQAMLGVRETLRRENEQALGQILDKKQQQRLKEISLRAEGPLAVARPDVAERLNVNDAQAQAIQGVMLEMFQTQRQMMMQARAQGGFAAEGPGRDQMEAMRLGMSRLRRAGADRIGQILDKKQKANFDKMLGAPFDLAKLNQADDPEAPDAKPKADEKAASKDAPKAEADDPPKKDATKPTPRKKSRR